MYATGGKRMSKDNRDFFSEKKIWSEVKDELLGCYLVPYFNKVLSMGNPILYVDCFAGKGKFDDGKLGSPLTALQSLDSSLSVYRGGKEPSVNVKLIELNHSKVLESNIPNQHSRRCEIISGKFEDKIVPLLRDAKKGHRQLNVFLYVDPYGVKVLNAALFDSLATMFDTAELLINLNSFGFIREACRVKKVHFCEKEDDIFSDIEEYESSILNSIQELDDIAGGDYWQTLINDYSARKIDCYETEKEFSRLYRERLKRSYKYVLDMPIRLKQGQHPKYRMIHATNHPDGCMLMADNIAKRTDRLVIQIQGAGQLSLMPQTAENDIVSDDMLVDSVKALLERATDFKKLNTFLADFYNEYGVLCKTSKLSSGKSGSILKTLEKNGYIEVQRSPAKTKEGNLSRFWLESKGNTLMLRKRR